MLGSKVRHDVLLLSLGQTWVASFFPPAGGTFPAGTTAECVITDPAGVTLATWTAPVVPARIDFVVAPMFCDQIPEGSYFRVAVHYPAAGARPAFVDNIARGSVIRDDNPTPLAPRPPAAAAGPHRDDMPGPLPDPNWIKVGGWANLKIWDNSWLGLPKGLGADYLLYGKTAARWKVQAAGDAVTVKVSTVIGAFTGAGRATVIVASNQQMTSWVGFQLRADPLSTNRRLSIVRGSSPTAYVELASTPDVVADNGSYTFVYNPITDTYLAYKGSGGSPVAQWTDSAHQVPHGNGYRYPGVLLESDLLSAGVQLSSWQIEDN